MYVNIFKFNNKKTLKFNRLKFQFLNINNFAASVNFLNVKVILKPYIFSDSFRFRQNTVRYSYLI